MKVIKIKFIQLLMVLVFSGLNASAQHSHLKSQNANIEEFIKIWALVKYKSQKSVNGSFNADKAFLNLVDSVKNADKKQFNQLMCSLVGPIDLSFAAVANGYSRKTFSPYQHLLKNVDYRWIRNSIYSPLLRQRLNALTNQVNLTQKHQYVPSLAYENVLPNEAPYLNYTFDQENMNLLTLAKAWAAIEYLFPYKYLMDKNWKTVLSEMMPVFRKINDRLSYEKALLTLAVSLNDTHAGEAMGSGNLKLINTILKARYYPPFDYQARAHAIIVKKFINDSLAKSSLLQVGDEIVTINGIKMNRWLKKRAALIPASNNAVKYRELSASNNNRGDTFAFNDLENGILNVKVHRDGSYLNLKLMMLDRYFKQDVKLIEGHILENRAAEKSIQGKQNIGDDIILFRAGNFFDRDLPEDQELEKLSVELKSKRALIFDMRKYPQSPGLFSYYLPMMLGKAPFAFARYYAADQKDPGTFIHLEGLENYMYIPKEGIKPIGDLYQGKIVILTDENTQSMGEWFTMLLQQINRNTTVIGSQTAGADGDVKRLTLPGGYRFSFSGNGIYYPDGGETQRIGIKPNIYFKATSKQVVSLEDAHLQRAVEFIRTGK